MGSRINKARYWWAVLWLDSLSDDWRDKLADKVQIPFAYCVHDKDLDKEGDTRKPHVHVILAFANTTTYSHALSIFKLIGGDKAVNTCEAVVNIRHAYDYLIHDTETCRKADKHKYDILERITGNNFDIGLYEQISSAQKREMLMELRNFIMAEGFTNIVDFTFATFSDAKFCENSYQDVMISNTTILDKFCAGNYKRFTTFDEQNRVLFDENCGVFDEKNTENNTKIDEKNTEIDEKNTEKNTKKTTIACIECGSVDVTKRGKTAGGTQRFYCKDCGKVFSF